MDHSPKKGCKNPLSGKNTNPFSLRLRKSKTTDALFLTYMIGKNTKFNNIFYQ